jgi:hypothetical protein
MIRIFCDRLLVNTVEHQVTDAGMIIHDRAERAFTMAGSTLNYPRTHLSRNHDAPAGSLMELCVR